jgi:N-glycosylase/DNA lyase
MEKLCIHYGTKLGSLDDGHVYYDFPSPSALSHPSVEQNLRQLGFGYRAKYIQSTASTIAQKPADWLSSLRTKPYPVVKEALLELSGVGPKVADCVCLFSLDQPSALPVDTHVWQIATRDYKFKLKGKKVASMTKDVYNGVGDFFRGLWGEYAGWAQSVNPLRRG